LEGGWPDKTEPTNSDEEDDKDSNGAGDKKGEKSSDGEDDNQSAENKMV